MINKPPIHLYGSRLTDTIPPLRLTYPRDNPGTSLAEEVYLRDNPGTSLAEEVYLRDNYMPETGLPTREVYGPFILPKIVTNE